jgi:mRNA interferase HigB
MRVIKRKTLCDYWKDEPEAEAELKAWFKEAEHAEWRTPAEVKAKYGNASILKEGRVVFNISGNNYRLVVKINYDFQILYIRFVGTHKAYDKIDAQVI